MLEKVAVIGVGYVGLPLAVCFAEHRETLGFDINRERIAMLQENTDLTGEVTSEVLRDRQKTGKLSFSSDKACLTNCDVFIITVPTPVNSISEPDLSLVCSAIRTIAPYLSSDNLVILESTVYPGYTEELMVPLIEELTGLVAGSEIAIGYSPERINPGDRQHSFGSIDKVVSGFSEKCLERVSSLYSSVLEAPVHKAPSMSVAEAAKCLENTQRDINVALMNEMAQICDLLKISVSDVIEMASTKWNFLRFEPGLVGGHCIGVDPYYLTFKARELGFDSKTILAGRVVNNEMPRFIAAKATRDVGLNEPGKVLVMGAAFKENCPDIRNSLSRNLVMALSDSGHSVRICDALVAPDSLYAEYGGKVWLGSEVELKEMLPELDLIIVAVPHECYVVLLNEILENSQMDVPIFEVKKRLDVRYDFLFGL